MSIKGNRGKREYTYPPARIDTESRCLRQKFPTTDMDFSPKKLIDTYLNSINGQEERTGGWIRPSGLGFCDRSVFYDLVNARGLKNRRPSSTKLMEIGTVIHSMYQGWLHDITKGDLQEFTDELPIRFQPFRISGQVDGIFYTRDWLLEIKTVGKSAFYTLSEPRAKDILQAHVYMYLLDIPRCIMYYICRDDGEDREFPLLFDTRVWDKVEKLLDDLYTCRKNGTLPARIKNTFYCKECKYLEQCQRDPVGVKL